MEQGFRRFWSGPGAQRLSASVIKLLTQNRIGAAPLINEEGQVL
jgi:hypothetical protein